MDRIETGLRSRYAGVLWMVKLRLVSSWCIHFMFGFNQRKNDGELSILT